MGQCLVRLGGYRLLYPAQVIGSQPIGNANGCWDVVGCVGVEQDIYVMTEAELKANGIRSLPSSLGEAIACTEKSQLVRKALGDHIFEKFITAKKIEWADYRSHVHQYEIDKYLPTL